MKKVRIFTFLFFVAAAVIFTQASYCDQNDSLTSIRIKSLIDRVTLGEGGSATISFVASSNSTAVKSFSFTASAQGVKITDITTNGNTCSVTVEQPETTTAKALTTKADDVAVGSVTVTVTGALMNDGRVVLYTNGGGASAVCYVYAGDEDDEDEDEEVLSGLEIAEELEENTFVVGDNLETAGQTGYLCWHTHFDGDAISEYVIHCLNSSNFGASITITPDMVGKEYDMLNLTPLTKGTAVANVNMYLYGPEDPTNSASKTLYYSTDPDQSSFEIEVAIAKCVLNSDDTFSFWGYIRTTDGDEAYCHLNAPNPDTIK
ncbi:MAG: hypothetical protein K6G53_00680 [Bacteroidales bacterium]|nr:hypothetical protein [Bacteroidales bacterium]